LFRKLKVSGAKESDIPGKKILSYKAGRFQVSQVVGHKVTKNAQAFEKVLD
jgi:hypothetical protein